LPISLLFIVDWGNEGVLILPIPVLAEGVENKKQVELLKKMGCDAYQGYVYSKPLSIDSFKEHLIPK